MVVKLRIALFWWLSLACFHQSVSSLNSSLVTKLIHYKCGEIENSNSDFFNNSSSSTTLHTIYKELKKTKFTKEVKKYELKKAERRLVETHQYNMLPYRLLVAINNSITTNLASTLK
jgi:hypothetical protein